MIFKLNDENFEAKTAKGLKLIEFSTPWCGYCQKQVPVLEELDKVWIGQVNGDEAQYLVQKFHIQVYPTFLVLKDGKEVSRFSGYHTKIDIMNILMNYM